MGIYMEDAASVGCITAFGDASGLAIVREVTLSVVGKYYSN